MSADADRTETGRHDDADSADGDSADPAAERAAFPCPPRSHTDDEGRVLRFRPDCGSADERDSLAAMYDAFGPADRAQGIPPANPRRRETWLDRIGEGVAVVAWHDGTAAGHGVLLDGGPGHELALFVHPDYRRAGVGTALLRTLLGAGRSAGVERVWLSVQRTNRPAVRLYRNLGFSPTADGAGELEMARPLG